MLEKEVLLVTSTSLQIQSYMEALSNTAYYICSAHTPVHQTCIIQHLWDERVAFQEDKLQKIYNAIIRLYDESRSRKNA